MSKCAVFCSLFEIKCSLFLLYSSVLIYWQGMFIQFQRMWENVLGIILGCGQMMCGTDAGSIPEHHLTRVVAESCVVQALFSGRAIAYWSCESNLDLPTPQDTSLQDTYQWKSRSLNRIKKTKYKLKNTSVPANFMDPCSYSCVFTEINESGKMLGEPARIISMSQSGATVRDGSPSES